MICRGPYGFHPPPRLEQAHVLFSYTWLLTWARWVAAPSQGSRGLGDAGAGALDWPRLGWDAAGIWSLKSGGRKRLIIAGEHV